MSRPEITKVRRARRRSCARARAPSPRAASLLTLDLCPLEITQARRALERSSRARLTFVISGLLTQTVRLLFIYALDNSVGPGLRDFNTIVEFTLLSFSPVQSTYPCTRGIVYVRKRITTIRIHTYNLVQGG